MEETGMIGKICCAAKAALLRYVNEERDISGIPVLARFLGDVAALKQEQADTETALNLALQENPDSRYACLLNLLGKDEGAPVARRTLELCILEHCFPAFDLLLTPLQDSAECTGVSLELILRVYFDADKQDAGPVSGNFTNSISAFRYLEPFVVVSGETQTPYRKRLQVDARLMGWLFGSDELDIQLCDFVELCSKKQQLTLPKLFQRQELPQLVAEQLKPPMENTGFVHLSGEEGSGRRLILRHACAILSCDLILVDCRAFVELTMEKMQELIFLVRREAIFHGAVICWHHYSTEKMPIDIFQRYCLNPMLSQPISMCVSTLPNVEVGIIPGKLITRVRMPLVDRKRRIELWNGFAEQAGLTLDCIKYGIKYRLGPAEIELAVQKLTEDSFSGLTLTDDIVSRVCLDTIPKPTQGNVKWVHSGYSFDDLKLVPDQKQRLLDICAHVWQSHKVFDEWRMESKYPYGRGVTALFTGPPGTGKTMAVHVISELLNLPLYQIELSKVVDKYIGETEKKLEEVFDLAEKGNTILFFDEADSMFGKRSDVSDAKDKYANTEVSYILQRIEQYEGIVILATNYKRNIDEAFMRRMRYVVEFAMPNEEIRRQIWESCLTKEIPQKNLDMEFLAKKFEFSGGNIKNIILNAAFMAAARDKPMDMQIILESVRAENLKFGKTMLRSDFGIYAELT